MPRTTVHRIVHRVTEEAVDIRDKVIHLPKTPEDLEAISHGFTGLARHRAFNKAVGAIDGCHVRIMPPGGPECQCYVNRKLFPSISLQAVCDHQGRFIDTYVGWPGSVHDARVLRHSPLYRGSVYPLPGHFILADGGYPCLQQPLPLITPYKRPIRGVAAQRFNGHPSRARSIIERAFGMMKTRFRAIFLQALEVNHTFVPQEMREEERRQEPVVEGGPDWRQIQQDDPHLKVLAERVRQGKRPSGQAREDAHREERRWWREWDRLSMQDGVIGQRVWDAIEDTWRWQILAWTACPPFGRSTGTTCGLSPTQYPQRPRPESCQTKGSQRRRSRNQIGTTIPGTQSVSPWPFRLYSRPLP
ncbi:hypothetical protein NHX12_002109 [Muraenolepis orangiensis]|uniref:DDE Tnp4 domain-containing protein n=1 Tax=Muraenolepis orangiensis TaxID=630683 RepID=A0A9Q0IHW2_9TELE|nr:hypothetical protein NHX12_002109 [Muraenolepis orangiensis]